jgi:hypothetical protein
MSDEFKKKLAEIASRVEASKQKTSNAAAEKAALRQSASPLNLSCATALLSMVLLDIQFLEGSGDRSRCVAKSCEPHRIDWR